MVHGLLSRSTEADPSGLQAPVAQGIEHSPSKRDAARSNRAGGTEAERWLPVVGFEGFYEVSDLGRIRRHGRRVLKPRAHPRGYRLVELCRGGKGVSKTVHRLVAEAFHGAAEGRQVNHKNGVKSENAADNLEWVSAKENTQHALATGLRARGPRARRVDRLALAVAIVKAAGVAP